MRGRAASQPRVSSSLDIVAIGDAIVDVIATADDDFVEQHALVRGGMQLLSAEQADELYRAMGPAREISGGSAANSMAGAAALGLNAAFVGQVADDQLGAISRTTCFLSAFASKLRLFHRRLRPAAA